MVIYTEENGDNFSASQPITGINEGQTHVVTKEKAKKNTKQQKWGPVLPTRRSNSHIDNGKSVMAKAQEFKRKWNLEDNSGITQKAPKTHRFLKSFLFLLLRILVSLLRMEIQ
jgi:hypothetical protein